MNTETVNEARALVAAVREAARRHGISWAALVPDAHTINHAAEAAEDAAYAEMARARAALRDHICRLYGLSPDELGALARS